MKPFTLLILLLCLLHLPASGKAQRTQTDAISKFTYHNFQTDSAETVFYQVIRSKDLVFEKPEKNSQPVYSLSKYTFVEYTGKSEGKFINIRVYDKRLDFVGGWILKNTINRNKYYGKSLLPADSEKMDKKEKKNSFEEKAPHWIKNKVVKVYADSTMTGRPTATLNSGDMIFVDRLSDSSVKINHKISHKNYISGFIDPSVISRSLLLPEGKTEISKLYQQFDPILLRQGTTTSSFVSYKGVRITGTFKEKFYEDKVCREFGNDSLFYKSSDGTGTNIVKKEYAIRGEEPIRKLNSYRILPNETRIFGKDTLSCNVVEIVIKPKIATIGLGNSEEGDIQNKKIKYYIAKIENPKMQLVIESEEDTYYWKYKFNKIDNKYSQNDYSHTKTLKRLWKFTKH